MRRIREARGIGQEALAESTGITQGHLSKLEAGTETVNDETLGRIAAALGVEYWVILAQAAGLKLEEVERFTEEERIWLDAFRALEPSKRATILNVAEAMRGPAPRKK
ncbi:MAG: helix-turn-helix transcriptional regulator [Betaproteobacteria bacterium]